MKEKIIELEEKIKEGAEAFFGNILLCALTLTLLSLIILESHRLSKKYVLRSAIFLSAINLIFLKYAGSKYEEDVQKEEEEEEFIFDMPVTPYYDAQIPAITGGILNKIEPKTEETSIEEVEIQSEPPSLSRQQSQQQEKTENSIKTQPESFETISYKLPEVIETQGKKSFVFE